MDQKSLDLLSNSELPESVRAIIAERLIATEDRRTERDLLAGQRRVDTLAKLSNALAVVLVAPAIALAGHLIENGIRERESVATQRELDLRAVEISVGILQSEPVLGDDGLRMWAARNISLLNPENPLDESATDQVVQRSLNLGPAQIDQTPPVRYSSPVAELGRPDTIDLLTWNIQGLSLDEGQRIANVAELLAAMSVDVVVLQEVGHGVAAQISAELMSYGLEYEFFDGPELPGLGRRISIFYRPELFEPNLLSRTEHPAYENLLGTETDGGRAFTYAPVIVSLMSLDQSGLPLTVIGVHLKSQAGGESSTAPMRRESAIALADEAQRLRNELGGSVLVIGTFNNSLSSGEFDVFFDDSGFLVLTEQIEAGGAGTYINPRFGPAMLDHAIALPGERHATDFQLELVQLDNNVIEFLTTVSDHLPLLARVE